MARAGDPEQLARLREALWPESSAEEHAKELPGILAGKGFRTMPLVELVAEESNGTLVGAKGVAPQWNVARLQMTGWRCYYSCACCDIPPVASLEQPADRGSRRHISYLKFALINPV